MDDISLREIISPDEIKERSNKHGKVAFFAIWNPFAEHIHSETVCPSSPGQIQNHAIVLQVYSDLHMFVCWTGGE